VKLDFEELLAEALEGIDEEVKASTIAALVAAVDVAEAEARRRSAEVADSAVKQHKAGLATLDAEVSRKARDVAAALQSVNAAQQGLRSAAEKAVSETADTALHKLDRVVSSSLNAAVERLIAEAAQATQKSADARSELLGAIRTADVASKAMEDQIKAAQAEATSKAKAMTNDLKARIRAEAARAEAWSRELDTLTARSMDLHQARKWTMAMLAVGAVVSGLFILSGFAWSSRIVAQGQDELLQQVAQIEGEIAQGRAEIEATLREGTALADARDRIGAELNTLRQVQDQLGIELMRRDDREIQLRLGDATITHELRRDRTTVGMGDVRLRAREHSPGILVILDNRLTLSKTSIGAAAHGQEVWWTQNAE